MELNLLSGQKFPLKVPYFDLAEELQMIVSTHCLHWENRLTYILETKPLTEATSTIHYVDSQPLLVPTQRTHGTRHLPVLIADWAGWNRT